MPSPSPSSSGSPSPSSKIRRWQHTDSPLLWSNAVVGSVILHLLILVPIARIGIGDRPVSGVEELIAVEVISPSDTWALASPPSNVTPQQSSPIAANPPVLAPGKSSPPTATPTTPTPTPTPSSPIPTPTPTPSSPIPTPTPTPSSPTTPTPTPTPSSPTPEPTTEPTREPPPGESNSPAANPPLPGNEIPSEESGGNPEVPQEFPPPSNDSPSNNSGASDAEGSNNGETTSGSVVYRKSELPAGGCGGSCPDYPAQPQITPGQEFAITYLPTDRHCSGKTLVVTALVSRDGNATRSEVSGPDLDPNDPCLQIGSSMVNGWSFQPAQSGGSPVDSFLDIYLDLT